MMYQICAKLQGRSEPKIKNRKSEKSDKYENKEKKTHLWTPDEAPFRRKSKAEPKDEKRNQRNSNKENQKKKIYL